MSAYVVEDNTIRAILACIKPAQLTELGKKARVFESFDAPRIGAFGAIRFVGEIRNETDLYMVFGKAMMDLNVQAVAYRYNDACEPSLYDHAFLPPDPREAYRELRRWLYQCTEGPFDKTPLYKVMRELSNEWAHELLAPLLRTRDS